MEDCTLITFFLSTLLLATFMASPISAATTTTTPTKASLKFIKISCNKSTFPTVCYKTLSPYASTIKTNPRTLSIMALAVTIKAANASAVMVTKLIKQKGITVKESGPIKDCLVNIKDTIYRLKESFKAMTQLSGPDKEFQMNNAKTWASAAITDDDTCYDALSGKKVEPVLKNKIRSSMIKVEQLNSNALFFINHLNY